LLHTTTLLSPSGADGRPAAALPLMLPFWSGDKTPWAALSVEAKF
jgi:hypothetical protein